MLMAIPIDVGEEQTILPTVVFEQDRVSRAATQTNDLVLQVH